MAKTKIARTKTLPAKRGRLRVSETKNSNGSVRTYDDALRFLFSVTDYERMSRTSYNRANFNLARMNRILAELGNPHKDLRCVHIAGTKGKGSTAGMVAAMLRGAGYRVGLYISPHIMDIRERVTINEELIPQATMASIIASLSRIIKRLSKDSPTFFELMTAMAFKYFADNKVDYAVIEVGLGGRLDSTNVIKPEVCAITSIGYDHMAQLGDTLSSIASEKAGILKPGVLTIAAPQEAEALTVLRQTAEKTGCTLRVVGQDIDYNCRFEAGPDGSPINRICMNTPYSKFEHVNVPAPG
jgi:dihydrofolate synthase/folylpolyglutamate synthase